MAAIINRLLHLRPTFHSYARPYPFPLHHFSSSSDCDDAPQSERSETHSSSFDDVRASLQNLPPPPPTGRGQPPRSPFSFPGGSPPQNPPSFRGVSTDEARQRLAEFRLRSAPPPPSNDKYAVSLQELYKKNLKSKGDGSDAPSGIGAGGGRHSFDSIRQSVSDLQSTGAANSGRKPRDPWSLSHCKESFKMTAGPNGLPFLQKKAKGKGDGGVGVGFGMMHEISELGRKLRVMRPEKRKGKWFSLQEMSDRLAKVREAEMEDMERRMGINVVSDSLYKLKKTGEEEKKQKAQQMTIRVFGSVGAALDEKMAGPPKDHLYEKYFHPDNMSSAEKLKLELKKVRDEFKMSESDCGSARVQVAQLTTKIKHLSTALHKKDKHSKRGLLAMVQRRKKLLKYLRRTDWDSYCLVLSKLGLRDNPDIKA